jgi:hypothetical protein
LKSCARFFPVCAGWRSWATSAIPPPCRQRPARSASRSQHWKIRRAEDIAPAIEALKGHAEALYVCADPLLLANAPRINTLALAARLLAIHGLREFVEARGFMSYGPNIPDLWRRSADYLDKVLRGAKPGELPVKESTKFDLVINLIIAKALRLTLPPIMLARADEGLNEATGVHIASWRYSVDCVAARGARATAQPGAAGRFADGIPRRRS